MASFAETLTSSVEHVFSDRILNSPLEINWINSSSTRHSSILVVVYVSLFLLRVLS